MYIFENYSYSISDLNSRLDDILSQPDDNRFPVEMAGKLLALIDLTSLNGNDTINKIQDLCQSALNFTLMIKPYCVPAVCVYPVFIDTSKKMLKGSPIKVATVVGGFPSGQVPLDVKLFETKIAIDQGADEIDMVINRGYILENNDAKIIKEVSIIKEVCQDKMLKVILETGELDSVQNIRKASELALLGGADFIKTSTGKHPVGCTPLAFLIMLDTIKEYCLKTGKKAGIKAAGGISEPAIAHQYYVLVNSILGNSWLNPDKFRIGASRLARKLQNELS